MTVLSERSIIERKVVTKFLEVSFKQRAQESVIRNRSLPSRRNLLT